MAVLAAKATGGEHQMVRYALKNCWLEEQGVPDLPAIWIVLHYEPDARVELEPLCPEP